MKDLSSLLDSVERWVQYKISYERIKDEDGKISPTIPHICVICGSEKIEGFIKLKNSSFLGGKRYIEIPLCEKHYKIEKTFRNKWFRLIPVTILSGYFLLYLFITFSLKFFYGFTDLLFPPLKYFSWTISSIIALIIISKKLYNLNFGLNSFIELRFSRNDKKRASIFIRNRDWAQQFENLNENRIITKKKATEDIYVMRFLKAMIILLLLGFLMIAILFIPDDFQYLWSLKIILRFIKDIFLPLSLFLILSYGGSMVSYQVRAEKYKSKILEKYYGNGKKFEKMK